MMFKHLAEVHTCMISPRKEHDDHHPINLLGCGREGHNVDVGGGERRTLLSIAKRHGIPVAYRMRVGRLLHFVVHVDTVRVGRRPVARSTDKENTLLRAMYLLNQHNIEDTERRGVSPHVRFACHYEVRDEEIVVFFESDAGRR